MLIRALLHHSWISDMNLEAWTRQDKTMWQQYEKEDLELTTPQPSGDLLKIDLQQPYLLLLFYREIWKRSGNGLAAVWWSR